MREKELGPRLAHVAWGSMPKLLVVDDDPNHGRALAIGLRLEGFEVEIALDAASALRLLDRGDVTDVGLALVDLMLPGTNGLELCRELHLRWPEMRVVLTSGYHLSERQLLRSDCGVCGFVPKPYPIDQLVAFLREKLTSSPDSCRRVLAASVR